MVQTASTSELTVAIVAPFLSKPALAPNSDSPMPSPAQIPLRRAAAQFDSPSAAPASGRPIKTAALLLPTSANEGPPALRPPPPISTPPEFDRLSGYGWGFVRATGVYAGLAGNGQLGGNQAGIRLDYALGENPAHGFLVSGRISAALEDAGREAAIGIGWKPGPDIPVTFTLERRIGLDKGGRNAFAAGVAGGMAPIALPAGFAADAYAQAGVVGLKQHDGFIDGAASIPRPVVSHDALTLSMGAGVWGAAQPGASRLDIGPRARIRFGIGGMIIGAALDWRQRIAGNAEPGSGLTFTLDGSF